MAEAGTCAECGLPLAGSTGGLCQRCLLKLGLQNPAPPARNVASATTAAGAKLSPASSPEPPTPRTLAQGRYRLLAELGEGGQKQVHLALDTELDREVVVALLKTGRLDKPGMARLRREARALARLGNHPHIVTIYDIGEENGRSYIVTQYLHGGELDALLRSAPNGQLPIKQVLQVGREVSQALRHAHEQGILHRDLKPANIWLSQDGSAQLGDFGLATGLELSRISTDGVLQGTVAYIAPEVVMGQPPQPQSDLYSLGVTLYEMATGRLPFVGDTLSAILSQHLNALPVSPSWHNAEIPAALDRLILELLAKLPEDRPAHAGAVEERLAAMLASSEVLPETARKATPLDRLAAGVFVGRNRELQALRAGLEEAVTGRGRLFLLMGEAGGGKTAIAEQFLTYARIRRNRVLRASCYEGEGAPAYWPWVQLLRHYARERTPAEFAGSMGAGAAVIAGLDPELRERLPALTPAPALEPEQARFRLFDSVTTFLRNASVKEPLVIFIDDLHWADPASLRLLQFLARELDSAGLLVIGTCRDPGGPGPHPFMDAIGGLAARGLAQIVEVRGLNREDVARFIEITAAMSPPERLVASVFRKTEGNPFFVKEVVRLLAADGSLDRAAELREWSIQLPRGVRDVLTQRLSQVSRPCRDALAVASVIGTHFDLSTLETGAELAGDALLELLDEAMTARLVAEHEGRAGEYAFSHALIRETLYAGLTGRRRLHLHRRIGEALEKFYGDQPDEHLGEIAYHFAQAIPAGPVDKAIDYAVRAGARYDRLLAYEAAAGQYEAALRALDAKKPVDPRRQCALVLALGAAQTKAGLTDKARETYTRAAGLAREHGWTRELAGAALGIGAGTGAGTRIGRALDQFHLDLLQEALGGLAEADDVLRARLLSQLSLALYHAPDERIAVSLRAVEVSRRARDIPALIGSLYSRSVALEGFAKLEERLAIANELVQIADQVGDGELAFKAHFRRYRELFELGDMAAVDRETGILFRLAEDLRQPRYQWYVPYVQASLALFRGRFADAEESLRRARAIGEQAQDPNAALFCGVAHFSTLWLRGEVDALLALLSKLIETYPLIVGWRAHLARLYGLVGRHDEARRMLDQLSKNGFESLPVDGGYTSSVGVLCIACFTLQDPSRAALLFERLHPFAGRNIVTGNAAFGAGAVAHPLSLAVAAMGQWDRAESLMQDAVALNRAMGARPWLALALFDQGRVFRARGRDGDAGRAAASFRAALAEAEDLGMSGLCEWAEAGLAGI